MKEILNLVSLKQPVSILISDPHYLKCKTLCSVLDFSSVEISDKIREPMSGLIESQIRLAIACISLKNVVCIVVDNYIIC